MLETDPSQAPRVLLEVGLAVLRIVQPDLLGCSSFADAAEVLRTVGTRVVDASELVLLSRSPECSLMGRSMGEWRRMHGGLLYADLPETAPTTAESSAAPAASPTRPVGQSIDVELCEALGVPVPLSSEGASRAAPTHGSSSSSGAAAPATAGPSTPAALGSPTGRAGRKRVRGSEADDSPDAALLSLRAGGSALRSPAALAAARRATAAAAAVAAGAVLTPPPVDISSSLERVFSPIAASPAAAACASPRAAFDLQRSPVARAPSAAFVAGASPSAALSPAARLTAARRFVSPRGSPATRARLAAAAGAGSPLAPQGASVLPSPAAPGLPRPVPGVASSSLLASPALESARQTRSAAILSHTAQPSRSLLASPRATAHAAALMTSPRGYRCSPLSSAKLGASALRSPAGARSAAAMLAMQQQASAPQPCGSPLDLLEPSDAQPVNTTATPSAAAGAGAALASSSSAIGRPRGPSLSLNSSFILSSATPFRGGGGGAAASGTGASKRGRASSVSSAADIPLRDLSPVAAPHLAASALAAALNPSVAAASARKAQRGSVKKPPRGFARLSSSYGPSSDGASLSSSFIGGSTTSSAAPSRPPGVSGHGAPQPSSSSAAASGSSGPSSFTVMGARFSLRGMERHSTSYSDFDADASASGDAGGATGDLPMDWPSRAPSASGLRSRTGSFSSIGQLARHAEGDIDDDEDDEDDDEGGADLSPTQAGSFARKLATDSGAIALLGSALRGSSGVVALESQPAKRMRLGDFAAPAHSGRGPTPAREMQPLSSSAVQGPGANGRISTDGGGPVAAAASKPAMQMMMLSPPRRAPARAAQHAPGSAAR